MYINLLTSLQDFYYFRVTLSKSTANIIEHPLISFTALFVNNRAVIVQRAVNIYTKSALVILHVFILIAH